MAPLGVALLLGIVIAGTAAIVVLGGAALDDTQGQTQLQRSEHVLTLFDSRTAMVALGDSNSQTTTLAGTGTYDVESDTGRIRIRHVSYNGSGNHETVYDKPMGSLTYTQGDTKIAYEGGGVWRKGPSGNATMITPPEFFYRQSTLTFPLIRVTNEDSASGSVNAEVVAEDRARAVYPNQTAKAIAAEDGSAETGAPYDPVSGVEERYSNPMTNGTLYVFITSDYYRGWAEYFRTRTDAQVTTFDSNNTVKANLVSLGQQGKFDMPREDNGLRVAGLADGGHSIQNFSFTLSDDNGDNADLDNLEWSFYAVNGQRELMIHLKNDDKTAGISQTVYYSDDGGTTYHGWINRSAYEIKQESTTGVDANDDDDKQDAYINVDLTSDMPMTYAELNKTYIMDPIDNPGSTNLGDFSGNQTAHWHEHESSVSWEPKMYDPGDQETAHNVTAHYFEMMGDEWELTVKDKKSETVEETESFGRIEYPGSAKFVAYLHVTENEVTVTLNG